MLVCCSSLDIDQVKLPALQAKRIFNNTTITSVMTATQCVAQHQTTLYPKSPLIGQQNDGGINYVKEAAWSCTLCVILDSP